MRGEKRKEKKGEGKGTYNPNNEKRVGGFYFYYER